MVVIGVFSSCETRPRNSSFASFARRNSASVSCASRYRRALSIARPARRPISIATSTSFQSYTRPDGTVVNEIAPMIEPRATIGATMPERVRAACSACR